MRSTDRSLESSRFPDECSLGRPKGKIVTLGAGVFALISGAHAVAASAPSVKFSPATVPAIATINDRFESYNVEMAEVIGGKFWKPYDSGTLTSLKAKAAAAQARRSASLVIGQDPTMFEARRPIDLSNPRLRRLAHALGPCAPQILASRVRCSHRGQRVLVMQPTEHSRASHRAEVSQEISRLRH
jgi:hypothetical protein